MSDCLPISQQACKEFVLSGDDDEPNFQLAAGAWSPSEFPILKHPWSKLLPPSHLWRRCRISSVAVSQCSRQGSGRGHVVAVSRASFTVAAFRVASPRGIGTRSPPLAPTLKPTVEMLLPPLNERRHDHHCNPKHLRSRPRFFGVTKT